MQYTDHGLPQRQWQHQAKPDHMGVQGSSSKSLPSPTGTRLITHLPSGAKARGQWFKWGLRDFWWSNGSTAAPVREPGFNPGQGTRSLKPRVHIHSEQRESTCTNFKTPGSQINKWTFKKILSSGPNGPPSEHDLGPHFLICPSGIMAQPHGKAWQTAPPPAFTLSTPGAPCIAAGGAMGISEIKPFLGLP